MQSLSLLLAIGAGFYLLLAAALFLYQRRMIYFPTAAVPDFNAAAISIDNRGTRLHGWVLNPGRQQAMIYFGGNSESITHRRGFFEDVFADYSVYLIDYRGYGASGGKPSESGFFSDALAIYDDIVQRHESITAYGRSLGSGVAVFLAAHRPLVKLILLTPYDSITAVAQRLYPLLPVRLLLRDRFDSAALAPRIDNPVFIASAEHDRRIDLSHTLALKSAFERAPITYCMVAGAAHHDIVDFAEYREALGRFIAN